MSHPVITHTTSSATTCLRQVVWLAGLFSVSGGFAGCAHAPRSHEQQQAAAQSDDEGESQRTATAALDDAPAVRDNSSAPILAIMTVGSVIYPYVYGYPLHPDTPSVSGLAQLRRDNQEGAGWSETTDHDGVVHAVEELPALGCRFEGIRETPDKYVPVSLTCELPAPKALGGGKRPVLGTLKLGAKAEEILKQPTIQDNFYGSFHLISEDKATASETGYFNTTHGQLALVFSRKKLARFVYYFDPDVRAWQNPEHWVTP